MNPQRFDRTIIVRGGDLKHHYIQMKALRESLETVLRRERIATEDMTVKAMNLLRASDVTHLNHSKSIIACLDDGALVLISQNRPSINDDIL